MGVPCSPSSCGDPYICCDKSGTCLLPKECDATPPPGPSSGICKNVTALESQFGSFGAGSCIADLSNQTVYCAPDRWNPPVLIWARDGFHTSIPSDCVDHDQGPRTDVMSWDCQTSQGRKVVTATCNSDSFMPAP